MRIIPVALISLILLIGVVSADTSIVYTQNGGDGVVYYSPTGNYTLTQLTAYGGVTSVTANAGSNAGTPALISSTLTNNFNFLQRAPILFKTDFIGYQGNFQCVTASVYYLGKSEQLGQPSLGITGFRPILTTGGYNVTDYGRVDNIRVSTDKPLSAFISGGMKYYNYVIDNTTIVSKTGYTPLMFRLSWDIDNNFSGVWAPSKQSYIQFEAVNSVGINPPYLTIEWTPDTTPSNSITGITNTSQTCNQITWTYTNPTTADFSHTLIYKDNAAQANAGNTTTTIIWSGLNPSQAYTISTKTVDLTGNVNATWTNQTAIVNCPETYSWCGRQDVFFYNQSSNLTGYQKLNNVPEKDMQRNITSASITASSGEVTLGTWITDAGSPGTTSLAPGSWDFRSYFTASSSAGRTSANYRIFNQTPNGTKTWLFFGSAITKDIISGTIPAEYQTSYARRNYTTFYPGDRLGIQINVSTDSASARTVKMDLAGNTNASMVSIAYFLCPDTAVPTTAPGAVQTWQPEINPSTDIKTDYMALIKTWWWLPVLMLVMIMIFGRK
jgi:hypothetical protein